MIKTKNLLASLSLEIPVLEEGQEGQLRGGFSAFGIALSENGSSNGNCNCDCSTNKDCDTNGNCNCKCTINTTSTPTPKSRSNGSSLFGSSFLL